MIDLIPFCVFLFAVIKIIFSHLYHKHVIILIIFILGETYENKE
jgi:hypothetical protein